MRGSRVRRPSPSTLLLLTLFLSFSWSCQLPGGSAGSGSGSSSSSSTSEAERTRAMEEKAAEIERRAEEIRNMEGTDQEKIDAVNRLDQDRRELERMQEGGAERP